MLFSYADPTGSVTNVEINIWQNGLIFDFNNIAFVTYDSVDYGNYVVGLTPGGTGSKMFSVAEGVSMGLGDFVSGRIKVVYRNATGGSAEGNPILAQEHVNVVCDTVSIGYYDILSILAKRSIVVVGDNICSLGLRLTGDATATIDGNLTGSVGSVAGNVDGTVSTVGSVSGSVASVTGSVGSVVGSVGSVIGTVGGVSGTISGNMTGLMGVVLNGTLAITSSTTTSFSFLLSGVPLAVFRAQIITTIADKPQNCRARLTVGSSLYWRNISSITDSGGSTATITFNLATALPNAPSGSPTLLYESNLAYLERIAVDSSGSVNANITDASFDWDAADTPGVPTTVLGRLRRFIDGWFFARSCNRATKVETQYQDATTAVAMHKMVPTTVGDPVTDDVIKATAP